MWVIDDRGRVHTLAELPRHLGTFLQGMELANYAVQNLGFIYVEWRRRRVLVRLRPKLVAKCSLIALWYCLYDWGDRPCTVSWLDDDGREELMFGSLATMRLIEVLREASPVERGSSSRLTRRPLPEAAFR